MLPRKQDRKPHLVTGVTVIVLVGVFAQAQEQPWRWDLMMIQEAPIWKPMLAVHLNGTANWPVPKSGAEFVLKEYSRSRWANDARLILAGGLATTEGGLTTALGILDSKDPALQGDTIVIGWRPRVGCLLDQVFMMNAGGLVFLNEDGSVRTTKPFDRNSRIHQLDREVLAYFRHLDRYPRKASTVAKLLAAKMHSAAGREDRGAATVILEGLVEDAKPGLAQVAAADRKAADADDGYHLRRLWRPEYEATLWLARIVSQEDPQRAADITHELAQLVSPAGQSWRVNEMAGDFALLAGREAGAQEQFQQAIDGLMQDIARDHTRETKIERSSPPPGVEPTPTDLERNLAEVKAKTARLTYCGVPRAPYRTSEFWLTPGGDGCPLIYVASV